MKYENKFILTINSNSKNESFARVSVATFASQLDPTLDEINDIKMAVSEAVTNSIIHGYEGEEGEITIFCGIIESTLHIEISDKGKGISDIKQAMTPLYTSKPDLERSGMGFTVMETFMDNIFVSSEEGKGTVVCMTKKIQKH